MKKIILSLLGLMLGCLVVSGQVYQDQVITADTATNGDTITSVIPVRFNSNYADMYYEIYVTADSLTGSTGGTVYLQQAVDDDGTLDWYTISGKTLTVNGTGQTAGYFTNKTDDVGVMGEKLRLYVITSGTQTTAFNAWCTIKKQRR